MHNITHSLKYLKRNPYLLFLWLFVIAVRLPVLIDQLIPFQFDHGKDAIGSLHMWWTYSPKLIGPWTSIPGLFFGPAWYYMLLPGMIISGGSPVASAVTMLLLGLLTVAIAYKYFGPITATVLSTSSLFYTITTSAWNPFPMVFVTFVLLAVLKHIEIDKIVTTKQVIILGFFAALGFHFSTAFAIFYPVLVVLSLLIKKIRITIKQAGIGIASFLIPFIPQLLFELKHNFIEVKAVIAYLQQGDSDPASLEKLMTVLSVTWGELRPIIVPPSYFSNPSLDSIFMIIFILLLIASLILIARKGPSNNFYLLKDAVIWFTLPIVAFTFLHFNLWYVLPLAAFTYVLLGQLLAAAPKPLRYLFLSLCFVMAITKVIFYISADRESLQRGTTFLPIKHEAIEYIYAEAGDRPFASYHYMPDIYDYPYQYLYFIKAHQGSRLPTEFSYKPGESAYIPEKPEILDRINNQIDTRQPEVLFFIVESSNNQDLLNRWWDSQHFGEIIKEQPISDVLTVYTATPSN